jgi:hypothetical protein
LLRCADVLAIVCPPIAAKLRSAIVYGNLRPPNVCLLTDLKRGAGTKNTQENIVSAPLFPEESIKSLHAALRAKP